MELETHLPESKVVQLSRAAVQSRTVLEHEIADARSRLRPDQLLIAVIDQHEESVAERGNIPTAFVESLALLDRGTLRMTPVLFIWLTTSREFQSHLADATNRNQRILVSRDFSLSGPEKGEWPAIIEDTFRFHNGGRDLADYEVLTPDLIEVAHAGHSLGEAIATTGERLYAFNPSLHDLSQYMVVMLWPVCDGLRIQRVQQFTDARQGYKLDWNAWYRDLNNEDKKQLPLQALNRARLYFDLRLVPIAAADLYPLCQELDNDSFRLHRTYLERLGNTHFVTILRDEWNPDGYAPLRERESQRATRAKDWYETVTSSPTKLGQRIARALRDISVQAQHERMVESPHSRVRADVFVTRQPTPPNVIVELKAFSSANTMPSTISDAIKTTLRRHAQLAGFLPRQ
ncbi:hypothetical protein JR065_08950 [Xanthomonas sp. AmX2]|uniref:hypothetical protein n=1 Tax=Xanthomonas sp. TaxID=29446 RepID=UPI00197D6789|nr:hypothetical protein [Xanthomonas sp.]MBN6150468.1 hypothetical protein [Xanthomonas sp.]